MTIHLEAAEKIKEWLGDRRPVASITLGSGLGTIADKLDGRDVLRYEFIPGFSRSTVDGHAGRLVSGRLGGKEVLVMQGRFHVYEGHPVQQLANPVRTLAAVGITRMLLTNAAGSLREDVGPGRLSMVTDHLNLTGMSPLRGPNDSDIGPRFVDMRDAYNPKIRADLAKAAEDLSIPLAEGVYAWMIGPTFETPAEIRALRILGADLVGMSTVPEVIAARHVGVPIAAISVVTNFAAGMVAEERIDHQQTVDTAATAIDDVLALLTRYMEQLDHDG